MGRCLPSAIEEKAFAHFKTMPQEARDYIGHHVRNSLQVVQGLIYYAEACGAIEPRIIKNTKSALEHIHLDLMRITCQEEFDINEKAKSDEAERSVA